MLADDGNRFLPRIASKRTLVMRSCPVDAVLHADRAKPVLSYLIGEALEAELPAQVAPRVALVGQEIQRDPPVANAIPAIRLATDGGKVVAGPAVGIGPSGPVDCFQGSHCTVDRDAREERLPGVIAEQSRESRLDGRRSCRGGRKISAEPYRPAAGFSHIWGHRHCRLCKRFAAAGTAWYRSVIYNHH